MKKLLSRTLGGWIFAGVVAATPAFAQMKQATPARPVMLKETNKQADNMKGIKVAFVDVQAAILQTEQGKNARESIERDAKKRREELLNQQKDLKKLDDDFQSKQAVMSEEQKAAAQRDFQKKYENFRNAQMGFEQEFRDKEMKETQKIFQNLAVIIEEVSKKKNYDMVFERGAGALLYASRIDDLTDEVVSEYNKRHTVKK